MSSYEMDGLDRLLVVTWQEHRNLAIDRVEHCNKLSINAYKKE